MNTKLIRLAIMLSPCIGGVVFAGDAQRCPAQLSVIQVIQGAQASWQSFNSDDKHPFIGVSFSEGSPDKKVVLAPDTEQKKSSGIVASWALPPSADGYWVTCLYAETSATVGQKLPDDVRSCLVEYDGRSSPSVVLKWQCR